jgi:RNAse (barnase) inhibitor barstar
MAPRPSLATYVQSTKAPWVALLVVKAGQRVERLIPFPDGFSVHVLKGAKCRTASGLFAEFARALGFPDYFGHNWDALEECLADLEWLPAKGYVLLVNDAEQVLPRDEEDYATFLEVLSDAGEAWASGQAGAGSQRATPFHVLLAVVEQAKSQRAHWAVPEVFVEPSQRPKTGSASRRGPHTKGRS